MLSFVFRRKIFRIQETAFCSLDELRIKNADVAYLHSNESGKRDTSKGSIMQNQYTLATALSQSEDELLASIKKNCKYEIRRSEKEGAVDNIYCGSEIPDDVISRFEKTYNQMFATKGLAGYTFNRDLVMEAKKANSLVVSCCTNIDGENEVFHAYLGDGVNCVLMYSASPLWNDNEKDKAKQIGMMNKYLHWRDIVYFKKNGYRVYEWGGISNPEQPNGIDKFKMEFGGKIVQYNNYIIPKTPLGYLYTYLVRRRNNA